MRLSLMLCVVCALAAAPVTAQQTEPETEQADDGFGGELRLKDEEFQTFEQGTTTARAQMGRLRILDKTTGRASDVELEVGQTTRTGRLELRLKECRYPVENPAADAFAWLEVTDPRIAAPLFAGWMMASSPALMALDHPRYDVWVTSCGVPSEGTQQASEEVAAGLRSPRPKPRP